MTLIKGTLFWLCIIYLPDGYLSQEPPPLVINEVDTLDGDGGFVEIYNPLEQELGLDGFSMITATRSKSQHSDTLAVQHVIDLSGTVIKEKQHYAIVSTVNNGENSLVPLFPNSKWRVFGKADHKNWLRVEQKKFMVVFLIYSPNINILDVAQLKGREKTLFVQGDLLEHIKLYARDYISIKKFNGPSTCHFLESFLKPKQTPRRKQLDAFLEEYTGTAPYSINRCASLGNIFSSRLT